MFKKLLKLLLVSLTSCCPMISGPPGDQGAQNWKASVNDFPDTTLIDCGGKETNSLNIRISNTTVQNCIVNGNIRVWGSFRNANDPKLIKESKKENYVSWIRETAPTNTVIQNVTIIGNKTVPLYIGPGVTFTTIKNVKILGSSDGPMVYLDAESHHTVIEDSFIDGRNTNREAIAIDASDHNILRNNTIKNGNGGIFLYRNCGENGVTRHTTPSYNQILNNSISGKSPAIWLSAREGNRCYCSNDTGINFGSSSSDLDHARNNVISNNQTKEEIKTGQSAKNNIIK